MLISRAARWLIDTWLDRTWLDWLIASSLTAVAVFVDIWDYVQISDRSSFYQTMSGISLAFLSLGTVTVTLVVTVTPSSQLREVLAESGRDLITTIFKCLWALIVSTLSFTALYALDSATLTETRVAVFLAGASLMVLSGARLLWLLQLTLRLLL